MTDELRRVLGARDLMLLVVGSVIGSGIFIVPANTLQETGQYVGPALLVWLVAGVLSLLGALTYAELGAMNPKAGGLYVYVRDAFGPLPAFLYGWTMFFAISSGAVATLAVAASGYATQLVPLGDVGRKVVSVTLIAIIAAVNVRGTRHGAEVVNWATAIKVVAILVMSAVLIALAAPSEPAWSRVWPDTFSLSLFSGAGAAMVGVLWAYEGWQYVTFSAGEALDPPRTLPRALFAGTLALVGLYLLANVAYITALGPGPASTSEAVAADALRQVAGPVAGKVLAAAIIISMFSAANSITLTSPRVYFAMARDGVFFRQLAQIHPNFGTPAIAVIVSSVWAIVLALNGTFQQLLTYVVFAGWIFYGLGAWSVFVYRKRQPHLARPFRVPGYPWTPMLFILSAAVIVLNTLYAQPKQGLLGLGVVLLGAPAYLIWRKRAAAVPS